MLVLDQSKDLFDMRLFPRLEGYRLGGESGRACDRIAVFIRFALQQVAGYKRNRGGIIAMLRGAKA